MNRGTPDELSITPRRDSRKARLLTAGAAWLAMGGVCLAVMAVAAALLYPLFTPMREEGYHPYSCSTHAKQLGNALRMYMQDYDDRLPAANTWSDDLFPYVKNAQTYVCPDRPGAPGYAFNATVSGRRSKSLAKPTAATLVLFESNRGVANAADPLQSFIAPHAGQGVVVFADGRAQMLPGRALGVGR
jgi:hypothetical protein